MEIKINFSCVKQDTFNAKNGFSYTKLQGVSPELGLLSVFRETDILLSQDLVNKNLLLTYNVTTDKEFNATLRLVNIVANE